MYVYVHVYICTGLCMNNSMIVGVCERFFKFVCRCVPVCRPTLLEGGKW